MSLNIQPSCSDNSWTWRVTYNTNIPWYDVFEIVIHIVVLFTRLHIPFFLFFLFILSHCTSIFFKCWYGCINRRCWWTMMICAMKTLVRTSMSQENLQNYFSRNSSRGINIWNFWRMDFIVKSLWNDFAILFTIFNADFTLTHFDTNNSWHGLWEVLNRGRTKLVGILSCK